MNAKCDLVLVAGGSGSRYGARVPKQFEEVHGRPLYLWSLEVFLRWPEIGNIVLVVPQDWVEAVQESFKLLIDGKPILVVAGGASRQASAANGLRALSDSQNPWVMVHDSARPAITLELLERLWEARKLEDRIEGFGGAVPGVQAKETIKQVVNYNGFNIVEETLPREKLCVIQTPQLLKTDLLKEAYAKASDEKAVDDASLLEELGFKILVVPGDYDNLKVTFLEDKERVSSWLRQRHPPL
jgi:2-C-methyl-D-erythritol 4-phosphate cytidylyltransferase